MALRARGATIQTIVPDQPSLDAIGPDLMDPSRRARGRRGGLRPGPAADRVTERFYGELATWWPLISPEEEYAEEAAEIARLLGSAREVLELGSGGGSNAFHLKARFALTLVDLSEEMLAVSRASTRSASICRATCGRCGSDRDVRRRARPRRDRLHDHRGRLRAAFETAFAHCRPGGLALFIPDEIAETFEPGADHGGTGDVRYLEWSWDPDPDDTWTQTEYVFLLREAGRCGACTRPTATACSVARRGCDCCARPASTPARSSRRRPRTARRA